jgi:hypothetical protein
MRSVLRLLTSGLLALTVLGFAAAPSSAAKWDGRYSVYSRGSFSYQHTNYTCVGASVQMMLNLINDTTKHSARAQKVYWRYGRDHGRYQPGNNGVDPVGWVAALEHFGAGDYAVHKSTRYQATLRALARAMRTTDRPVGLFVDHGGHAWVMTGFASTGDPALGGAFRVTALQVMGPLYPNGTINGRPYDPAPGTWMSIDKLRNKYTPMKWRIAPEWRGRWLAVIPR